MDDEIKIKTYLNAANDLINENPDFYSEEAKQGIVSFARYLDSFKTLSVELQILAMEKSRLIDREVLLAVADEFGKDKVAEIVRKIHDKHTRRKK